MGESFDLTRFYHKEEKEYRFPLSGTVAVMVGEGHTHRDTKRRRNNEDSITLSLEVLIQFNGCLPNISDSTDVKMIVEQGLGVLGFQPQDGCLLSEDPTEETQKRKNQDYGHVVPKQKTMRQEEQAVFVETLLYGNVRLSNSFSITSKQFHLHDVERMLVEDLYASVIRLRIYNYDEKGK